MTEEPNTSPRRKGTIACGVLAICLGVVGFVHHEDARLNGATVVVAVSAIVFLYFALIAAALLLLFLVAIILSALGVSP